jgi:1-acyl-sn-glycerol-3-phosphate acyltransferase
MLLTPKIARGLAKTLLPADVMEWAGKLEIQDNGHGFDPFGLHPSFAALGLGLCWKLHHDYFRVKSYGVENIPTDKGGVIAANHSGTIPTDAMMLWADVLLQSKRIPRPIADHFVPSLPWFGVLFARSGMVGGSRGNARALLSSDELLMIFPEGVGGIGKNARLAYQLQKWHLGHAELAIRHGVPVIPTAIIGPEEQMPQIGQINSLGKLLGLPYMPIPLTPIPLPVRYHIHYGEPIPVHLDYRPEAADDPNVVREAAGRVRSSVESLIEHGLASRENIFE